MSDAVSMAVGFGTAVGSLWSYYLTVVVGLVAAIAALSTARRPLDRSTKAVVTTAILLFSAENWYSLYWISGQYNSLVDYISSSGGTFGQITSKMKLQNIGLYIHPLGPIAMIWWLWTYRPVE